MTDPQALPPPEGEPVAEPKPRRRLALTPIIYLIGFLVLAGALAYLWRNPPTPPQQASVDPAAFDQLRQDVAALGQRVTRLDQRPAPAPPNLQPLEARLTALEKRPEPQPAAAPTDLKPLEDRIAAVEQKINPDVATHADLTNLSARVDAIATRQDQLASRQQGLETGFGNRMDKVDNQLGTMQTQAQPLLKLPDQLHVMDERLGTTEKAAGQVASVADRAARIARIQAAESALESGQPIGTIPNAPPALARFANAPPPTEAELRLTFTPAAKQAELASIPSTEGKPVLDRLWTRAQMLVMLREGDRVIVGDPAAGVIARAREALLAGDLRGAVDALNKLNGPAAQAMASWKSRAQSLLDARAALATLAANA
jgi:hypothetical protein